MKKLFLLGVAILLINCHTASQGTRQTGDGTIRLYDIQNGHSKTVTPDEIGSYTRIYDPETHRDIGTRVILRTGEIFNTDYDSDYFQRMVNGTFQSR